MLKLRRSRFNGRNTSSAMSEVTHPRPSKVAYTCSRSIISLISSSCSSSSSSSRSGRNSCSSRSSSGRGRSISRNSSSSMSSCGVEVEIV